MAKEKPMEESCFMDGVYETQLLGPGPEAEEGARAAERCVKNPGHGAFIPTNALTNQHLPECFRHDEEVFEFVKVTADITVRLRVGIAGGADPDTQDGANDDTTDENGGIRTGSGHIRNIELIDSSSQYDNCGLERTENRECWSLAIHTAKHVVSNEKEAKRTSVDFFYDSEESRREGGGMRTLKGGKVVYSDDKIDWCWLEFTTCDAHLATYLKNALRRWDELRCTLREQYSKTDVSHNIVWVVSHPHGISKHITFGEVKEEEKLKSSEYDYLYSYSADTCAGSSGAGVWGVTKCKELTYSPFDYFGTRHCKGAAKNGWNTGYY